MEKGTGGVLRQGRRRWVGIVALMVVAQAGTAGVSLGAGTIVDLGHLSSNYYGGSAPVISADGRVVAGTQQDADGYNTPYRWTAATGMQALPRFGGYTLVNGINGDGSVIVGYDGGNGAFKWTQAGGMVGLPASTSHAIALGISADGQTIVGSEWGTEIGSVHWVTWSGDGTVTPLSDVAGNAYGVSADGSVIAGRSPLFQPAYWTQASGVMHLPLLPGGTWGQATAVSGDGSTIVGYIATLDYVVPPGAETFDTMAFRWTAEGGLEDLGHLAEKSPGHSDATAMSVSGDGRVVGGYGTGGAFVWDDAHGMRSLSDVLASVGIDAQGWHLGDVTGISADGMTLVGSGLHDGIPSMFVTQVPASVWVPEPGGGAVALIGAGIMSRGRRRRCHKRR